MALDAKVGQFNLEHLDTGVFEQSVTGVGFTPKCIIFWSPASAIEVGDSRQFSRFSIGISDGTNNRCITYNSGRGILSDGSVESNTLRRVGDDVLERQSGGGGTTWNFTVQSFDIDGFTIFFNNKAAEDEEDAIFYLALGGDDITNAAVGSFDSQAGTARQFVNVGFRPDFLFIMGANTPVGLDDSVSLNHAVLSIGMASRKDQYVCGMRATNNALVTDTGATIREDIIATFAETTNDLISLASINAFLDEEFVLDWEVSTPLRYFYLALAGPSIRVGINQAPDVATKKSIPNMGFAPKAMLALSNNVIPTVPNLQSNVAFSFGGGDATSNYVVSNSDPAGATPGAARQERDDKLLLIQTPKGNTRAIAEIHDLGVNEITLDWELADPPAQRFAYVAFGDTTRLSGEIYTYGNVLQFTDVGAKRDTPIRVSKIVWSGIAAAGNRLKFGESSAVTLNTNTLLQCSAQADQETIEFDLDDIEFANGLELVELDSGSVFVYETEQDSQTPIRANVTDSGDTELIAAPGVGLSLYIRHAHVSATDALLNNNRVSLREGGGGTYIWRTLLDATPGGTLHDQIKFEPPWKLPANTALVANMSTGDNTSWTIQYFIAA